MKGCFTFSYQWNLKIPAPRCEGHRPNWVNLSAIIWDRVRLLPCFYLRKISNLCLVSELTLASSNFSKWMSISLQMFTSCVLSLLINLHMFIYLSKFFLLKVVVVEVFLLLQLFTLWVLEGLSKLWLQLVTEWTKLCKNVILSFVSSIRQLGYSSLLMPPL